jgi:hypothetical protein
MGPVIGRLTTPPSDPNDDTKVRPSATFPSFWPPVTIDDNAENLPVDPVSHRNIVAALNAKNPTLTTTFTCTSTHDTVGRDTVHVKATAGGDSYKTDTVKLKGANRTR